MARFAISFLLLLLVPFILEFFPWAQTWLIKPWTSFIAHVSAEAMGIFDAQIQAQDKLIWDPSTGFAIVIEAGCNGVEAAIILIAAMLAFPAPWRSKLTGMLVGLIAIQILNIMRVISLFYLGQWNRTIFEWAHLYVWQALIMLDVLLIFLVWVRWVSVSGRRAIQIQQASPAESLGHPGRHEA